MSNLENLRKQAKRVLRWHRDGYYPVAAQIRAVLPRFRHMSDAEILAHAFKLSDAQELVARQAGFEDWQALKEGVATMPTTSVSAQTRAVLTAAEPELFVADITAACTFFTQKLGFAIRFTYGEPAFYAQVTRDAARLNLRCVSGPVFQPGVREKHDLLSAAFTVATAQEIKSLFQEFQAAGVSFHQPLKQEPWGARNFIVSDTDGNLLLFAGPAE